MLCKKKKIELKKNKEHTITIIVSIKVKRFFNLHKNFSHAVKEFRARKLAILPMFSIKLKRVCCFI